MPNRQTPGTASGPVVDKDLATPGDRVSELAIACAGDLQFGRAPRPVTCGRGLEIGAGTVIPEINFTLPPMVLEEGTRPHVMREYAEMVDGVCRRAVELEVPGLLVEFETLPPMTVHPEWALEVTGVLAATLDRYHSEHGLRSALRLTPNDNRDHERPPAMRSGPFWDGMVRVFDGAAAAGADLLAIESTGGKEVCDQALLMADLTGIVFALGVLAPRDMAFLWERIVAVCRRDGIVASGDSACGFANTAMALADRGMIPRVLAAVVRVATVPRSLVAYEAGAVGPSKDCAYEGPYMKAIAGVPISMEGRSAACAHFSRIGNIAQAVCDAWSNESVQNVQLLSGKAPVVSMEQLAYDCRLMNAAAASGPDDANRLRDWLVASDAALDPQAFVLQPEVVIELSAEIVSQSTPYLRTVRAVQATVELLRKAHRAGCLRVPVREVAWLDRLASQADDLPYREDALCAEIMSTELAPLFLPEQYGLSSRAAHDEHRSGGRHRITKE